MPKNKIEDLRNMLFETMERLLDDDDQKMDLERAETISKVAQTIINSAKVEVDFMKQTGFGGSDFLQSPGLPGARQLNTVPAKPVVISPTDRQEDLCQKCTLPECDDHSDDCLIQIQKRAA